MTCLFFNKRVFRRFYLAPN